MPQGRTLPNFVGTIYDAALDKALWPDVLGEVAEYVGGQAAGIISTDTVARTSTIKQLAGFDRGYMQLYSDEFFRFDPLVVFPFARGETERRISDMLAVDAFREGRFNREWLVPQGWADAMTVALDKTDTTCSILVVVRHETIGLVDEAMRARVHQIAPHLRRAFRIEDAINLGEARTATFTDTLDGLSAGMFLIDGAGGIVHANRAGRAILDTRDFLCLAHDQIEARDPAVNRALRSFLQSASSGEAFVETAETRLPLVSRDDERFVGHMLSLPMAERAQPDGPRSAVAALFVHKASMDSPSLPDSVARHYDLTPTEIRVLLGIVEVGGGPEVAAALGIADSTVKTHLHRLYQKTGTRRQTDLVKLVAGFANPLLN